MSLPSTLTPQYGAVTELLDTASFRRRTSVSGFKLYGRAMRYLLGHLLGRLERISCRL